MYNILLTDDEQIVIDSLTMILNKNFQNQVLLFTSLSGQKALDVVRSKPIDIIFMDIHMPGINGLETISLIKQINPNIVIIILSAYDQFQYAKEALNLGAYKYLTKPVNRNLIVQTARDAMNIVDSLRGKITDTIALHEKLSFVSTMVESDFIYSCIFNNKNTDFSEYLSYFGIQDKNYFMCCIELPEMLLDQNHNRYEQYTKVRDIFTSKGKCIIGSMMGNKICAFFPLMQNNEHNTQKQLYEMSHSLMNEIFTLLTTNLYARIRLGVSEIESSIKMAQKSYNASLAALNATPESGGIIFFEDMQSKQNTQAQIQKIPLQLYARIRQGDTSSVQSLVLEYIELLYNVYGNNFDKVKNNVFEYLINTRNIVIEFDSSFNSDAFENAFSILTHISSRKELEDFVVERTIECSSIISSFQKNRENPIIKKARDYIENHLAENIGLETLSSVLDVSPYYLSKLFKEKVGENLINYITDARLEKAKKLLADDSFRIKEITASVGYNDQNYFSKLFKQKFSLTPTEYRESIFSKK